MAPLCVLDLEDLTHGLDGLERAVVDDEDALEAVDLKVGGDGVGGVGFVGGGQSVLP